ALARVDVLTDGASSIYGGDAVAGVINFVLREDFEGAETSLRYGSVTQGDMQELRISQALGTVWNSGNILATAEYSSRDNLVLADRPDIAAPSASAGGAAGLIDLMPEQERWSGVIVANQSLTPSLDVSASALYTKRTVANSSYTTFRTTSDTESETSTLNLSADYAPTDRWSVSGGVTFSSLTNDELLTTFRTSPPVPAKNSFGSEIRAADLLVNGDLFDLPGGTVKLALGGHLRSEDFYFDTQRLGRISEGERDVAALYGEILLPVVGPDNATRGIRRLELNLSGRRDDYSDFGSTFNPKAGLLWSPAEGLNLRSSYSTSFTPPPLGRVGDQNRSGVVYPYTFILNTFGWQAPDPSLVGTDYLIWAGAFNDLEPETSRTFTGGADFEVSQGAHTWTLRSTYYDIRFEDRLGSTPIPNSQNVNFAPNLAFTDPGLLPAGTVLFFPSQAEVDALVASFSRPVALLLGASLNNIGIINNASAIRNLAATETQGLDLSLGYERDASFGRISAGLNANYILDFSQQAATSTPSVTTLNTLYNPVDLKLRANLGLSAGGFAGSLFVNHTDRYRTEDTPAARDIGAWTTADMNLAYSFEGSSARWLERTSISLSVLNLFDVSPPRTPTNSGFRLAGYDPTNASPLGRFVAVELRKSF
ncbi:MAG: TonB-dependent receptor, partial [Hyphomonas sp.]|nr:TonB-dependent receptor [Hyphomonas sp.]